MKWFCVPLCLYPAIAFSQATLPSSYSRPIIIAHRGDHTHAPENTIPAIENAIADGAEYVELDLRTTKDGKLVILHDPTVDRMTDGSGLVTHLNFKELRKLKVQDKSHPEFGTSFIPTFEEILNAIHEKINLYLDFKDADVALTWDLLRRNKMDKSVVVYINSLEQYTQWRKVAPSVPIMVSLPDSVTTSVRLLGFMTKVDAEILDGSYQQYTKELVQVAESKGRVVWADIQQRDEGPELWNKSIQTQLHGIQTDHPAELIQYLRKMKIR